MNSERQYVLIEIERHNSRRHIVDGDFAKVAEKTLELTEIEPDIVLSVESFDEDEIGAEIDFFALSYKGIDEHLPRSFKHWQICDRCNGEGACLISGLEGVAFTADEFDEQFDYEERDRYFNGGYDRSCPDCNGTGKVLEVDLGKLENRAPLLAKERLEWIVAERECEAEYAAERRMGA
jgi:hypothetical protein